MQSSRQRSFSVYSAGGASEASRADPWGGLLLRHAVYGTFEHDPVEDAFLHYLCRGWLNHILIAIVMALGALANSSSGTLSTEGTTLQRVFVGIMTCFATAYAVLRFVSQRSIDAVADRATRRLATDGSPSAADLTHHAAASHRMSVNQGLGILLADAPDARGYARIGEQVSVALQLIAPISAAGFVWGRSQCYRASTHGGEVQCTNTFSYDSYPLIMNTLFVALNVSRWLPMAVIDVTTVVAYLCGSLALAFRADASSRLAATLYTYIVHSVTCAVFAKSREEVHRRTFMMLVEVEQHAVELRRTAKLTAIAATRTVPPHVFAISASPSAPRERAPQIAIVTVGLTCFSAWAQHRGPCEVVEALLQHAAIIEDHVVHPLRQGPGSTGAPHVTRLNAAGDVMMYCLAAPLADAAGTAKGAGAKQRGGSTNWLPGSLLREWLRRCLALSMDEARHESRVVIRNALMARRSSAAATGAHSFAEEGSVSVSVGAPVRNSGRTSGILPQLLPVAAFGFGSARVHYLPTTCCVLASGPVVDQCCAVLRNICDRAAPAVFQRASSIDIAETHIPCVVEVASDGTGHSGIMKSPNTSSTLAPAPIRSASSDGASLGSALPTGSSGADGTRARSGQQPEESSAESNATVTPANSITAALHQSVVVESNRKQQPLLTDNDTEAPAKDAAATKESPSSADVVADGEPEGDDVDSRHPAMKRTSGLRRLVRTFVDSETEAAFRRDALQYEDTLLVTAVILVAWPLGHVWTCVVYSLSSTGPLDPLPYAIAACALGGSVLLASWTGLRRESRWAMRLWFTPAADTRPTMIISAEYILDKVLWCAMFLYTLAPLVSMQQTNVLSTSMAGWIIMAITPLLFTTHRSPPIVKILVVAAMAIMGTAKTVIVYGSAYSVAVDSSVYTIPAIVATRLFTDSIAADRFTIRRHIEEQKVLIVSWMHRAKEVLEAMVPTEEAQTLLLQRCTERNAAQQILQLQATNGQRSVFGENDDQTIVQGALMHFGSTTTAQQTQSVATVQRDGGLVRVMETASCPRDNSTRQRRGDASARLGESVDAPPQRQVARLNPFKSTVIATKILERAIVILHVRPAACGFTSVSMSVAGSHSDARMSSLLSSSENGGVHTASGGCVESPLKDWEDVIKAVRDGLEIAKGRRESFLEMAPPALFCDVAHRRTSAAAGGAAGPSLFPVLGVVPLAPRSVSSQQQRYLRHHLAAMSQISVVLTKQVGDQFIIAASDKQQNLTRSTIVSAALNALVAIVVELKKLRSHVGTHSHGGSKHMPPGGSATSVVGYGGSGSGNGGGGSGLSAPGPSAPPSIRRPLIGASDDAPSPNTAVTAHMSPNALQLHVVPPSQLVACAVTATSSSTDGGVMAAHSPVSPPTPMRRRVEGSSTSRQHHPHGAAIGASSSSGLHPSTSTLQFRACCVWSATVGALVGDFGPTFEWYGAEIELGRALMRRAPEEGGPVEWETTMVSEAAADGLFVPSSEEVDASRSDSAGPPPLTAASSMSMIVLQGTMQPGLPVRTLGMAEQRVFHPFVFQP